MNYVTGFRPTAGLQYAFANPNVSYDFVAHHAQEMDETVRQRHIDLYVNDFTEGLGNEGRAADEIR